MDHIGSVAKWQGLVTPIHRNGARAAAGAPTVRFDSPEKGQRPAYHAQIALCLPVGTRFALARATDYSAARLKIKVCGL